MDAASVERLTSMADPRTLSALKKFSGDPVAAKAVAGQFGALLMQGMLQSSYGESLPIAGGGAGGNIVSSLFASTVSQAAMSGDKLGLADMLFRSIDAKQRQATAAASQTQPAAATLSPPSSSALGLPLSPYWQGDGSRPLGSIGARARSEASGGPVSGTTSTPVTGKAGGASSRSDVSPTSGWSAPPSLASDDAYSSRATSSAEVRSFSRQLGPLLKEAGRQLGVSPRILLAQAALETGWGRSMVGNNVFGIKASASWTGSEVSAMTHEVEGGQTVPRQASFRAYPTLDAAVQDYVALVGGRARYQAAVGVGNDAAAYGRGLVAGGYATDPAYARKLEAVAASQSVAAAFDLPNQPARLSLFATAG